MNVVNNNAIIGQDVGKPESMVEFFGVIGFKLLNLMVNY